MYIQGSNLLVNRIQVYKAVKSFLARLFLLPPLQWVEQSADVGRSDGQTKGKVEEAYLTPSC